MKKLEKIVLKGSVGTQCLYIFIFLIVILMVSPLLFFEIVEDNQILEYILKFIGGCISLFIGSSMISMLLSFNKELIIIDSEGFIDNGSYNGFIPWSNVKSIYEAGTKAKWVNAQQDIGGEIEIELIDGTQVVNALSKFKKAIVSSSLSTDKAIIFINLGFVKKKPKELIALMNKYLDAYQEANSRFNSYEDETQEDNIIMYEDEENFDRIIIKRQFLRGCLPLVMCLGVASWATWGIILTGMDIYTNGIGDEWYLKITTGITLIFQGLFVLFFGSVGFWQIYNFKTQKPVLIIDPDGFTDSESNREFIIWSDVEKFDVVTRSSTTRDSDGRSSTTFTTTVDIKLWDKDELILIGLSLAKETPEEVADIMVKYHRAYIK